MKLDVAILQGRAHGAGSILPAVVARLGQEGLRVRVATLAPGEHIPPELYEADVIGLRHLAGDLLDESAALEQAGVRCCNRVDATAATRDKLETARRLADADVPAPAAVAAVSWETVLTLAGEPVVVKRTAGSGGAGVLQAPDGHLPPTPPFPGPYLVQEYLGGDGVDRKLYVVGDRVAGVLRTWPPRHLREKRGVPLVPDRRLARLALAAGEALGLEIFGVDVVAGRHGPAVVDVNAFPGFKGVPDAPAWIAGHLARLAWEVVSCES